MAAGVGDRVDGEGFVAPVDGAGGLRVDQEVAELAAVDLGAFQLALVVVLPQDGSGVAQDAHRLTTAVDDRRERVPQARSVDGFLPVVVVDVEHAALDAGVPVGLELEHCRRDAVNVQDSGGHQPAETAAEDGDRVMGGHEGLRGGGQVARTRGAWPPGLPGWGWGWG